MKAEGHRQAAEQLEKGTAKLQPETDPEVARLAIEGAWGASFQWIAFGCETKYQQHQNNHTRLCGRLSKENNDAKTVSCSSSLVRSRTSREWDPAFIDNVKRDGIILYQRVPLPAAFAT
jgi:hypothetical protein